MGKKWLTLRVFLVFLLFSPACSWFGKKERVPYYQGGYDQPPSGYYQGQAGGGYGQAQSPQHNRQQEVQRKFNQQGRDGRLPPAKKTGSLDSLKGRVKKIIQAVVMENQHGREVTVVLGPHDYMEGKGVDVTTGDILELSGKMVGPRVLVADKVTLRRKKVDLRGRSGIPLWRDGAKYGNKSGSCWNPLSWNCWNPFNWFK